MYALVNDPGWLRNIGDRKVYSIADAENYLLNNNLKSYRENGFGFWKVSLVDTGEPIGSAGLGKRPYLDDVDIGFAFLSEHVGMGYGYESAEAIMNYAQEKLGITRLSAFTSKDNYPSIRVLQKLGFHYTGPLMLEGEELNLYGWVNKAGGGSVEKAPNP